jgi:hypothetical protein
VKLVGLRYLVSPKGTSNYEIIRITPTYNYWDVYCLAPQEYLGAASCLSVAKTIIQNHIDRHNPAKPTVSSGRGE